MRLPLVLAMLMMSAPAASEAPSPSSPASDYPAATSAVVRAAPVEIDKCRPTRAHFANLGSKWTGERVPPKNLDELPPGTAYMAVFRTINGCEMPLTVVEYRNSQGR